MQRESEVKREGERRREREGESDIKRGIERDRLEKRR